MLAALVALALVGQSGCGGDQRDSAAKPQRLSAAEQAIADRAQAAVRSHCRQIGLHLTRRQPLPTAAETAQVNAELDRLIALARAKPGALTRNQGTARDVLGTIVEDLEGANCSSALEQKLEQALVALPRP